MRGSPSRLEVKMFQYQLQDLGFETQTHSFYLNSFYFQKKQLVIVSKSSKPSILFKLKQECNLILVLSLQEIKEYIFQNNGCIVKHL
jgi:hypothetical protein